MTAPLDSRALAPDLPDQETRLSQTSRVEAFSDGVMAIAITLLVLDLKVPSDAEARDAGSLIAALARHWPSYLAYLAAFLTIGIIWLNHRAFVDKIRRFDNRLHWLNLALLLGVATLPFPTALLAAYLAEGGPPAATAAVVYGLLSVATALPWTLMWRHIVRHPELLEPPYDGIHARAELRRASIGPLIYVLAVPLALFLPLAALLFYIGIAVLYALTSQGAQLGSLN
ncbi:MAG: DUF1211 domain-containing protein [Chloroflexi bacterium]|nr:MAG: DUF1211 domain-containing protein [Chloroflexota bacterium]